MKTRTLILLTTFVITGVANAQNPNYSIRDSINYVFEELNQSFITTGILFEKAFIAVDLYYYFATDLSG